MYLDLKWNCKLKLLINSSHKFSGCGDWNTVTQWVGADRDLWFEPRSSACFSFGFSGNLTWAPTLGFPAILPLPSDLGHGISLQNFPPWVSQPPPGSPLLYTESWVTSSLCFCPSFWYSRTWGRAVLSQNRAGKAAVPCLWLLSQLPVLPARLQQLLQPYWAAGSVTPYSVSIFWRELVLVVVVVVVGWEKP